MRYGTAPIGDAIDAALHNMIAPSGPIKGENDFLFDFSALMNYWAQRAYGAGSLSCCIAHKKALSLPQKLGRTAGLPTLPLPLA
ncbi:hypothetical protein [Azospirillum canadense]|uniref:hypothetical protein n=1 Tax=Azospirillum canadense TaxID=403962 RepID=UPI002226C764|nr:hypothetical protein [Azospirillum canadense]MCW2236120.1 hypothetical protein [Azospirillum canadense]